MAKKPTQRDRVRKWLEAHGSIKTGDALHVMKPEIRQLHERIAELRKEGMEIDADWVRRDGRKTKEYIYTLVGGPKKKFVPQFVIVNGVRKVRMVEQD